MTETDFTTMADQEVYDVLSRTELALQAHFKGATTGRTPANLPVMTGLLDAKKAGQADLVRRGLREWDMMADYYPYLAANGIQTDPADLDAPMSPMPDQAPGAMDNNQMKRYFDALQTVLVPLMNDLPSHFDGTPIPSPEIAFQINADYAMMACLQLAWSIGVHDFPDRKVGDLEKHLVKHLAKFKRDTIQSRVHPTRSTVQ